jgi:hypothetical protein
MTLPPSRKDISGPPPRDVTDLRFFVRHHGSALRRLDPGGLGGRFITPSPVRAGVSDLVGDDGGDAGADDLQAWDTDKAVVTVAGTVTLHLTYEPIEDGLILFWGLGRVLPTEFTRDGQTVTFTNPHLKVGHVVNAWYLYINEDPEPFTMELRGVTIRTGALPIETQVGDFVLIATRDITSTYSDARFPLLSTPGTESRVYAGNATDLSTLAPSGSGGLIVVASFVGSAAVTGVAYDIDPPTGLSVPAQSGSAAVAVVSQRSSFVSGSISLVTPWTEAGTDTLAPAFGEVGIYYWGDDTATSTPANTPLTSGGIDETEAYIITAGAVL